MAGKKVALPFPLSKKKKLSSRPVMFDNIQPLSLFFHSALEVSPTPKLEEKSFTIHFQLQPQIGRNDWALIAAGERGVHRAIHGG